MSDFKFNFIKFLSFLLLSSGHILAIGVIIYAFLPIARWYLDYKPVWGVDFFLLGNLVNLLDFKLTWPFSFWNYAGFGGWPVFYYSILHIYITNFIASFLELVYSVQIWMMASTLIFLVGCYFLFFAIGRNILLAVVLAVAVAFSSGIYQTLTWAGSLPSYATQAAFPWSLYFLVNYLRSRNNRWLLVSALVGGISVWGHPLIFYIYTLPASFILIFTNFSRGVRFFEKLKTFVALLIVSQAICLPLFLVTFKSSFNVIIKSSYTQQALSTTSSSSVGADIGAITFNKLQPSRMYTDNHPLPFVFVGLFGVFYLFSLAVSRKPNSFLEVIPYLLISGYFAFYIWIFGQGISIFHGGWYRLFWSPPVWVGMLAAVFLRESLSNYFAFVKSASLRHILAIGKSLAVVLVGAAFLFAFSHNSAIVQIIYRSQVSSAHPDIINLKTKDTEREDLKKRLTPQWINGDDLNFRLYGADQTVNLWWTSLFKMPLARGYLDPPAEKGYIFWFDAALSETDGEPQLVKSFGYPVETATSNALFLVDWNAVRYFEGGHIGNSYTPVPKYLKEILVEKEEVLDFNDEKYTKRPVTLNYSLFRSEYTSSILTATNASTVGIFASPGGYETVIRSIAERDNLNSQVLIPINLGKFIDVYDLTTLKKFDSLYLYDYDYKSEKKAFNNLAKYVENGKKVFIETGVEVKQSEGALSDFFPIKSVKRKGLGKDWNFEEADKSVTQAVNFKNFSPPEFDEDEWKVSYADSNELRGGANLILKNHGKIIMASQKIGGGEVIWSGMNLAYHLSRYHNGEEARLFKNLLARLVSLEKKPISNYSTEMVNTNTRKVTSDEAKGVLFKEQAYDGWSANLMGGNGQKLEIFKAGPANPGYMYIPLPQSSKSEVKLQFNGSWANRLQFIFSALITLLVFEEVVFRGAILGNLRRFIYRKMRLRVGIWWEKDEEE